MLVGEFVVGEEVWQGFDEVALVATIVEIREEKQWACVEKGETRACGDWDTKSSSKEVDRMNWNGREKEDMN